MFYPGKYATNTYAFLRKNQTVWFYSFKQARKAKVIRIEKPFQWSRWYEGAKLRDWNYFVVVKSLNPQYPMNHGSGGSSFVTADGIHISKQSAEQDQFTYPISDRREYYPYWVYYNKAAMGR